MDSYSDFIAPMMPFFALRLRGESWAFEGEMEHHSKFGDQVSVRAAVLPKPSGRLVIDYLCHHPAFRGIGIGRAKSERLLDVFGEDIYEVLDSRDSAKLSGVLTHKTAEKLFEAWAIVAQDADVISFLSHHGFDTRLAM